MVSVQGGVQGGSVCAQGALGGGECVCTKEGCARGAWNGGVEGRVWAQGGVHRGCTRCAGGRRAHGGCGRGRVCLCKGEVCKENACTREHLCVRECVPTGGVQRGVRVLGVCKGGTCLGGCKGESVCARRGCKRSMCMGCAKESVCMQGECACKGARATEVCMQGGGT